MYSASQNAPARKVFAKVLTRDGNRLLVPGLYYFEDDPEASPADIIIEAMMFSVCTHCNVEPDWLEFSTVDGKVDVPNVIFDMIGPQFAHGAVRVWLIGGPLFDEEMAKDAHERA